MAFRRIVIEQGTQEWLKLRRNFIGASEVPILFGASPYKTQLELFNEKFHGFKEDLDLEKKRLFLRGHDAERTLREMARSKHGLDFKPAVLISTEVPDLLASLDGLPTSAEKTIFEAKYVGAVMLEEIQAGKIPKMHWFQIQAQLLVSGYERCLYYALDSKGRVAFQEVFPEPFILPEIATRAQVFMSLVRQGRAPLPEARDHKRQAVPFKFQRKRIFV